MKEKIKSFLSEYWLHLITFVIMISMMFWLINGYNFCERNPLDDRCLSDKQECATNCNNLDMNIFRSESSCFLGSCYLDCYCVKNKEVVQIW